LYFVKNIHSKSLKWKQKIVIAKKATKIMKIMILKWLIIKIFMIAAVDIARIRQTTMQFAKRIKFNSKLKIRINKNK